MGFLDKLQNRWQLKSITQVIIVLIVFACTGFTIMFLKKPIMGIVGKSLDSHWFNDVLYYLFILPIYFIVLLFYGFVFGQFNFFKSFVLKTCNRLLGRKNKEKDVD